MGTIVGMCLVNILVNFLFSISAVGGYITGSISWVVHAAVVVVVVVHPQHSCDRPET